MLPVKENGGRASGCRPSGMARILRGRRSMYHASRNVMRTTYGLLIVSVLLFVFGIWFVLAGVRAADAPLAAPPVATVLEVMDGIVSPAAQVVYDSVATV